MSGIIRFCSDPHFGHRNMAEKRNFQDDFYHDEHIIDKWNSVVRKGDTTWILGDITMEKRSYDILDRLNGFKRVVLGNHDMGNHAKTLMHHVNSVHGMVKLRSKKYGIIFLTHCPIHPSEFSYRIDYNIHGHLHENLIMLPCNNSQLPKTVDERYKNVCMEQINYKPKTLDEIFKKKDS